MKNNSEEYIKQLEEENQKLKDELKAIKEEIASISRDGKEVLQRILDEN